MTTMKKPFSLEEYLANPNQRIETRDGRPVRIVATDVKRSADGENRCICALIDFGTTGEMAAFYPIDGMLDLKSETYDDLFFVTDDPEPAQCSDDRFEVIAAAKEDLIKKTNIQDSQEEMAVLDNILFRCWQMGWLRMYDPVEMSEKVDELLEKLEERAEECKSSRHNAEDFVPKWRLLPVKGYNTSGDLTFSVNGRYLEMTDIFNNISEVALLDLARLPYVEES